MAITVVFYKFSKRENSTATPGTGREFQCELKEPCSALSPTIKLSLGTENPTAYNYGFIPAFNRYYFVKNWTYSGGFWFADFNVDVLSSWKEEIGNSTLYVTRSSAEYNGDIIDNLYPATSTIISRQNEITTGFTGSLSEGFFVIGCISKYPNSFGAMTYYLMSVANVKKLGTLLLSDVNYLDISEDEISGNLTKVLFNPFQYIQSCIYFPFSSAEIAAHLPLVSTISVGWWNMDIPAFIIGTEQNSATITGTVTVPKHPQAEQRGIYCNLSPFSTYEIIFQPYGTLPMDSTKLQGVNTLTLTNTIDLYTGDSIIRVAGEDGHIILERSSIVGVTVPLANISMKIPSNVGGLVSAAAGGILGGIQNFLSGSDVANGIVSGINSSTAQVETKGTISATAVYNMKSYLVSRFFKIVDDDILHRGRPLCEDKKLSTIPGYIMVADADISIPGTEEENTRIKGYLESGFFYE